MRTLSVSSRRPEGSILPAASLRKSSSGLTLIELIVAMAIIVLLVGAAVPIARVRIKREREHQLREALWQIRDAIDRYKDAGDKGAFRTKVGSENYPPDLE